MDAFWGLSEVTWTAIYTILTALLLTTAWIAAGIAWGQWKASRDAVEEARRARLEASRPYVIVTVESTAAARTLFDLSVKNIGKRPAFNVRVCLDPPPTTTDPVPGHEIAQLKMLREPIAMIAPAQDMRAFWDDYTARHGRTDLPDSHRVTVSYSDSSGRPYHEESVLDLSAMQGATYVASKSIHDIGKTLDKIAETLKNAPILSYKKRAEVLAITETRETNEHRQIQDKYRNLVFSLRIAKAQGKNHEVAELEALVAQMEEMHPDLRQDESLPPASDQERFSPTSQNATGRSRLITGQWLRALLFRCPISRGQQASRFGLPSFDKK